MEPTDEEDVLKLKSAQLETTDFLFADVLKRRMDIALEVIAEKIRQASIPHPSGRKRKLRIYRKSVETDRLNAIAGYAREIGLNPHFARAMLYSAIDESCKVQMIRSQKPSIPRKRIDDPEQLKNELRELTSRIARAYHDRYDRHFQATSAYLRFEQRLMRTELDDFVDRDLALDLGCATGKLSGKLSKQFRRVVGYDISSAMTKVARQKHRCLRNPPVFRTADLEKGIPEKNSSVSFVTMNLGTASDIRDIESIITEIERVLKPEGRFFLSFYNKDALLYECGFMPWDVGLAAVMNPRHRFDNTVDVHYKNRVFTIFGRAYEPKEVKAMIRRRRNLMLGEVCTYPTIGSLLPLDLFAHSPDAQRAVENLDEAIANNGKGAYIALTGRKR